MQAIAEVGAVAVKVQRPRPERIVGRAAGDDTAAARDWRLIISGGGTQRGQSDAVDGRVAVPLEAFPPTPTP